MGFDFNGTTGQITMTRGDSMHKLCTLKFDGEVYEMQPGDEIHFGVKADYDDKVCLIRKEYTENPFILKIDPKDTKNLDFGTYYYDLQIVTASGFTYTFYEKKKLKLTEEVV